MDEWVNLSDGRRYAVAELAWCAGFLDGEGYFAAPRNRTACIEAAQVATRVPLDRLTVTLGGSVYVTRSKGLRGAWEWRLHGAEKLRRILPLLIPHLCVKREEAEIVLAHAMFTRRRVDALRTGPPTEEKLMRTALADEIVAFRHGRGFSCAT